MVMLLKICHKQIPEDWRLGVVRHLIRVPLISVCKKESHKKVWRGESVGWIDRMHWFLCVRRVSKLLFTETNLNLFC